MQQSIEVTGKTEEEAINAALRELNLTRDEVSIEIIERAKSGFLRIGASPAVVRVSYEVPDPPKEKDAAEKTEEFLDGLLTRMGTKANINVQKKEDGSLYVELSGDGMGAVIGRRGETLDALQYLTSLRINKGQDHYTRVTLDTENYRAKREDTLIRLANRMANRAVKTGRKVSLEPMNPYERRVIHSALQPNELVDTHSEGEEPKRHIVITLRK